VRRAGQLAVVRFATRGLGQAQERGLDLTLATRVLGGEAEKTLLGRGRRQEEARDRERVQAALRRQKK
jgi:hypothetical protein